MRGLTIVLIVSIICLASSVPPDFWRYGKPVRQFEERGELDILKVVVPMGTR